jgi:hypothetical protein
MDMRWLVLPLAVAAFSIASSSSAATLELGDVFDSARGRGNGDRIRYSGNADFGMVDLRERSGHGRGRHRGHGHSDRSEGIEVSFERSLFVTSIDIGQVAARNAGSGPIWMRIVDASGGEESLSYILIDPDDANGAGHLNIPVNRFASSISFVPTAGILSDFSLARITIDESLRSLRGTSSPIPEPSSVVMLLIGGVLVASQLRKLV